VLGLMQHGQPSELSGAMPARLSVLRRAVQQASQRHAVYLLGERWQLGGHVGLVAAQDGRLRRSPLETSS